jgi:hypothetical protein
LESAYLPYTGTNKKQRIWALVSDGKYSSDQIASMVGTSKEYVWKETSRCRKSTTATGLVLSRKTTQLSKRKDETSILLQGDDQIGGNGTKDISVSNSRVRMTPADSFHLDSKPDRFLNTTKMESEDLKILYGEFKAGKKPVDVIAEYGYNPDVVEFEYQRFMRLSGKDFDALLKYIVIDCDKYFAPQGDLRLLIDKYYREGQLQNEDIYDLLMLKREHEWLSRLDLSMIDPTETLPSSVVKLKCSFCNTPIPGALLGATYDIGISIRNQYINLGCLRCTDPISFDKLCENAFERLPHR